MCGIFGKLYFQDAVQSDYDNRASLDELTHRGPDDKGMYEDEHIVLGNTRLSICDTSKQGHMPMSNENKSIWITFNGEIYNYQELYRRLKRQHHVKSRSDTELIIHLYEEYGYEICSMLHGMFAFGIWDKNTQTLFLARDRLGKKPLKYYIDDSRLIFASELKAILKDPTVPRKIDYAAIDEYLTFGYVPSPKTGFEHICKLAPAEYMTIDLKGRKKGQKYWNLDFETDRSKTEGELCKELNARLIQAVRVRIPTEVHYGVHLSGGVDSSLITALLAKEGKAVKTFSVRFRSSNQADAQYARDVSRYLKTEHHEYEIGPDCISRLKEIGHSYEEPFADSSAIATWILSKHSKKDITVAFNGDGGDENFGGYDRHRFFPYLLALQRSGVSYPIARLASFFPGTYSYKIQKTLSYSDPALLYLELMNYYSQEEKRMIYSESFWKRSQHSHPTNFIQRIYSEAQTSDPLHKALHMDFLSYLSEGLMMKTDMGGMAHALEIRSPFLDEDVVEFATQVPSHLKVHRWTQKYLLKKVAEEYLPREILYRKKEGFGLPLDEWMRSSLEPFVREVLSDEQFISYGLFSREGLRILLGDFYNKQKVSANHIWSLITLKEWLQIWFPRN